MIIRYTSTMMICVWLSLFILSNVTFATTISNNDDQIKIHVLIYETAVDDENAASTASQRKRQLRSQSKNSNNNNNNIVNSSPAQTLVKQINDLNQFDLLEASIFGQGHEFIGFGSKLIQVLPVLKQMQQRYKQLHHDDSNTLIIISDSRDVLFNSHSNHLDDQMTVASRRSYVKQLVNEFHTSYDSITSGLSTSTSSSKSNHQIIISAEAQCCVSALTHVQPGNAYYDPDTMNRNQYSCSSGAKDCLWNGDEYAQPWEDIMKQIQKKHTNGIDYDDIYLNAGLMVGTVSNLIHVIESLQIQDLEDDQALLTDYMYYNPNTILLDYSQTLFGNSRGGLELNALVEDGCVFRKEEQGSTATSTATTTDGRLVHIQTGTKPLLLHTPGKYYTCYDRMSSDLGHITTNDTKQIRTRLLQSSLKARLCNYGVRVPKLGDGIQGNAVITGCEQYMPSYIAPTSPGIVPTSPVSAPSLADILGDRIPSSETVPVPTPTIFDVVPVPTPTIFDVVPVPTPSIFDTVPVPTPSFFDTVPVPTPSIFDTIISPTSPTVTVPTTTTTEGVPVAFLDLLNGAHSTPSVATAPADVPVAFLDLLNGAHSSPATAPSVEGVPTAFLDLLMTPTVPTTIAATPISAPTDGVPVSFLDLLGGGSSPAIVPTPGIVVVPEPTSTTTEQVPVSFFDLLSAPTDVVPTNDIVIVSTPTTPTTTPIVPTEESASFMDLLTGRSGSTESIKVEEPTETIVVVAPASAPVSIPTPVESTESEDQPSYFDFLLGDYRE